MAYETHDESSLGVPIGYVWGWCTPTLGFRLKCIHNSRDVQSLNRLKIGVFRLDPKVEDSDHHRKNFPTEFRPI